MGFIGGLAQPKVKVVTNVKNAGIDAFNESLLGDLGGQRTQGMADLDQFTKWWDAFQPQRQAMAGQESDWISRYFGPDMENRLAGLRSNYSNALRESGERAIGARTASRTAANLSQEGGDSSYARRQRFGDTKDILNDIALRESQQGRADLSWLENARRGLLGERGRISSEAMLASLVPASQRQAFMMAMQQGLRGITDVDQANRFYGLEAKKPGWARFFDAADTGILNVLSAYGGGGFDMGNDLGSYDRGGGGSGGGLKKGTWQSGGETGGGGGGGLLGGFI